MPKAALRGFNGDHCELKLNRKCKAVVLACLGFAFTLHQPCAQPIYATPYAFTNLAGVPGVSGSSDGTGIEAEFSGPTGIVVDSAGNAYVADFYNQTIRKVSATGVVTTLAGTPGVSGNEDGDGTTALFNRPSGIAIAQGGSIYVAEHENHTIRRMTAVGTNWLVTTIAGTAGLQGTNDGIGSAARFKGPRGLAVDSSGNVYVADTGANTIRKISPLADVTTFAGSAGQTGTNDGTGSAARFNYPAGVAVDGADSILVADAVNQIIRKISPSGEVSTLAGTVGVNGSLDGDRRTARFNYCSGIAADGGGNIYVADSYNRTIRKISLGGTVTTLAGRVEEDGSADGIGSAAGFYFPQGLAVDAAGNLLVADTDNNRVTKGTQIQFHFDPIPDHQSISNGLFKTRLTGSYGVGVILEASDSIQDWIPVQTNVLNSTGAQFAIPLGTNQHRLFRARLAPQ